MINSNNLKNSNEKLSKKSNILKSILRKIMLFTVIGLASVCVVVLMYFGVIYFSSLKYMKYEADMDRYGFTNLYNNSRPKSYEFVTKSEAIKLIIGATLNTNDISYLANEYVDYKYDNEIWVEYAKKMGIIPNDYITVDNQDEKEKYINIITTISNSRKYLLDKEDSNISNINNKNFDKFSEEKKQAISNLISTNIIENININANREVTKGVLNQLIIEYVENDNILTASGEKINIDEAKMPSNVDEFPYTVESVDKDVYEKEQYYFLGINYQSPIEIYKENKQEYAAIKEKVETYLSILFNVNYETINYNEMKEKIDKYVEINTDPEKLKNYINYVISNKVIISGISKFQDPILYYDGMRYRARVKVNYNVKNAKELINLVYLDDTFSNKVEYKLGENEILLDIPLKKLIANFYITEKSLSSSITGKVVNSYLSDTTDPMEGAE